MSIRRVFRPLRGVLAAMILSPVAGCAHQADAVTLREVSAPVGLRYGLDVDATRLSRGMGIPAVPAVAKLMEENLIAFFRIVDTKAPETDMRHELLAESPAPGYGVRVLIDWRPDEFCHVAMDVVTIADGNVATATLAPYSVHYAVAAVRAAMGGLHGPNRPPLPTERFLQLRTQATVLAQQGKDPPIDEVTFARTPRPLERLEEAPRYYAPEDRPSMVQPE